jgi:ATP-dependent Clp protease adaptor protein ClpS
MSTLTDIEEKEADEVDISELQLSKLIVFNDDVNSFEHVINTFMQILQHSAQQAEQCAYIIHNNGKCVVKDGMFDTLKPYRDAICERGIDARIL